MRRQRPLGERSDNKHAVEASSNDVNLDTDMVPGLSKVCVVPRIFRNGFG